MAGLEGIPVRFGAGEVVFSQGDAAADLYLVRSGSIEIVREQDGVVSTLEVVEAGGVFGEMAVFSPGPRAASAVAREDSQVEVVDRPTLEAYVGDPVVWAICAKLSERCRQSGMREDDTGE